MAEQFFSSDEQQALQQERFNRLSRETDISGERTRRAGLERSLAFDPSQAVTQFGQGFLADASENLGNQFEDLVGGSVGSGRLRTGFFQEDAGRLFQDFNRRVSTAIAQQSLEASRQSLANIQGLQRTGTDLLGQQIDLLGGAFDRATAEENAEGGGFFSKLAGAAGFVGGLFGDAGKLVGRGAKAVAGAAETVGRKGIDLGRDIFEGQRFGGQFDPTFTGPTQGRQL
jgi:hypothetical protein